MSKKGYAPELKFAFIMGAIVMAVIIIVFYLMPDRDLDFGDWQCKQNNYDKALEIHRSVDGNYIYAITCEKSQILKREEWN